ncbi:hypothetical protein AVEN_34094-1, partial [Araneus ventricosus]
MKIALARWCCSQLVRQRLWSRRAAGSKPDSTMRPRCLVVRSRLWGRRVPDSKPDSTEDTP